MNFEQYFSQPEVIYEFDTEYDVAKRSWNACKNEVLKLLQKYTIETKGPHGTGYEELSIDVIDEIRKL